jgi:hypothetical protein
VQVVNFQVWRMICNGTCTWCSSLLVSPHLPFYLPDPNSKSQCYISCYQEFLHNKFIFCNTELLAPCPTFTLDDHHLYALFYASEIWSPTLKNELSLSVFGNRVLRRISGPKWWEVWENCIIRSYKYSSPSTIRRRKSRRMRWAGNVEQIARK